jgi:hypothetical protein
VSSHLILVVLLVVAPTWYLGHRFRLHQSRWGRWGLTIFSVLAIAAALPYGGVALDHGKRINLLLCAAVLVLLALRQLRSGWGRSPRCYLQALTGIAGLAVLVYLNFFSFHGRGTYIHYHDVAHYYLGSKYFDELSYDKLYSAMLRAEAEIYEDHFMSLQARDLASNRLVDIRVLLRRSDPIKAAFTPARWQAFSRDVAFFRERMGEAFAGIYLDHGFNPTPVWALIGRSLANLVPAGSRTGILLLTLLDPLLLVVAFVVLARSFGRHVLLLSVILFCISFGTSFGWTGGAFLRYLWFFAVVIGCCCIKRNRPLPAGALLALATMLRVFPALLLFGILARAGGSLHRTGRITASHRRLLLSFAVTCLVLFLLSGLLGSGFQSWRDFRSNSQLYVTTISPNVVGLTSLLTFTGRPGQVTPEQMTTIIERRTSIYRLQLMTLLPLSLALVAVSVQRRSDLQATAMCLIPIFAVLNLGCYYYILLVIPLLARFQRRHHVVLIFAAELALYILLLFEPADAMLYLYRSLAVLLLLLAINLEPLTEAGRKILVWFCADATANTRQPMKTP